MLRLKRLISTLIVVLAGSFALCSAAEASNVSFQTETNYETGVVTVEGTYQGGAGKEITLFAYEPLPDGTTPVTGSNVYATDSCVVESDGSFSLSFTISQSDIDLSYETYEIRLGSDAEFYSEGNRTASVIIPGTATRNSIVSDFNAVANDTDAATLFTTYGDVIKYPAGYDAAAKARMNALVAEYKGKVFTSENPADDLNDVLETVEAAAFIAEFEVNVINETAFLTYMSQPAAAQLLKNGLGIDLANTEYTANKAAVDASLFAYISGKSSIVDAWLGLKAEFDRVVILTAVNNVAKSSIPALLEKYHSELDVDVSGDYTRIDSMEIAKAIWNNKPYTGISGIKTIFDSKLAELVGALNQDQEQLEGNGNNLGNAAGGGGGGGAAVPIVPPEKEEDKEDTEKPVSKPAFTDLGNVAWAEKEILALRDMGVIAGMTETEFAPSAAVTREQFVKMAVEAFGASWTSGSNTFADVDESAWYADYVSRAVSAGIVSGVSADSFGVAKSITRQDVAVILYRIMKDKLDATSETPTLKDFTEVAPYAADGVSAMWNAKILNGDENGYFNPNSICTRAQAAKLIYGAMAIMGGV